jgi:hypothetical protein
VGGRLVDYTLSVSLLIEYVGRTDAGVLVEVSSPAGHKKILLANHGSRVQDERGTGRGGSLSLFEKIHFPAALDQCRAGDEC